MAAGRGMRMMPLTEHIPKPLVTLDGASLISRGIAFLKQNLPHTHITVGYKGNMVAEHVISKGVNTIFNTNERGNSWWVYNTLMSNLNEPTFVLTCDNLVEFNIKEITDEYFKLGAPACLVIPVKPIKGLDGDYIHHTNFKVKELSRIKPSDIYCSGIQILNPFKINQLTNPTESFYELWLQLIEKEELYCSNIFPTQWTAIDTLDQLSKLSKNKIF